MTDIILAIISGLNKPILSSELKDKLLHFQNDFKSFESISFFLNDIDYSIYLLLSSGYIYYDNYNRIIFNGKQKIIFSEWMTENNKKEIKEIIDKLRNEL